MPLQHTHVPPVQNNQPGTGFGSWGRSVGLVLSVTPLGKLPAPRMDARGAIWAHIQINAPDCTVNQRTHISAHGWLTTVLVRHSSGQLYFPTLPYFFPRKMGCGHRRLRDDMIFLEELQWCRSSKGIRLLHQQYVVLY